MRATETARSLIARDYPAAEVVFLGGSAAHGGARGATSDLDLVVIGDEVGPARADTTELDGVAVEAFVADRSSLARWFEKDRRRGRAVVSRMCAEGEIVIDSGDAALLQSAARALLAAGPQPLTADDIDFRRYRITALYDDLAEQRPLDERQHIAIALVTEVSELALLGRGSWLGTGKWLARRLREGEPDMALSLSEALVALGNDDAAPLRAIVEQALQPFGGRLFPGFSRLADLPSD